MKTCAGTIKRPADKQEKNHTHTHTQPILSKMKVIFSKSSIFELMSICISSVCVQRTEISFFRRSLSHFCSRLGPNVGGIAAAAAARTHQDFLQVPTFTLSPSTTRKLNTSKWALDSRVDLEVRMKPVNDSDSAAVLITQTRVISESGRSARLGCVGTDGNGVSGGRRGAGTWEAAPPRRTQTSGAGARSSVRSD